MTARCVAPGRRCGAIAFVLAGLVLLCLGGCGVLPRAADGPACASLAGVHVPASQIGIATHGATVETARLISANATGNSDGTYCRVVGTIKAVQDRTPDIQFEVNLPTRWNQRALQMGGAGYNGELVTGTGVVAFDNGLAPLSQGYVTFGSDSGHIGNSARADFAIDDRALVNFGYAHLKKTHDVALFLIQLAYGHGPEKMYFGGGSTGGREGYTVIERFPADYDGVIANSPSLNFFGVRLIGIKVGQAVYGKAGGFVPRSKQSLVHSRVLAICDKLDGLVDGIVSDVEGCRALEPRIIEALRCPDGTDASANCLSDRQLGTLLALRDGLTVPYELADGVRGYPGYNVFEGTDFSGLLGLGDSPTLQPVPTFDANGYLFAQGDGYLKYFVAHDPHLDTLKFDLAHPGDFLPRMINLSDTVGSMNPDFSAYIARGGKLLTLQGLADEVISPNQTIAFYRTLVARYGQDQVDAFMRLYMVPGYQHGNGDYIPSWNALGALDDWVTHDRAPGTMIGVDIAPRTNGRRRPLCQYPGFPRYNGSGDVKLARSFHCADS